MTALDLKDIHKSYGATRVIHGIDLKIEDGEFVVFVGPSGCGKSTLLRMIAGLENITGGDMFIGGQRVNDIPPSQRGIAMVFQSYALYPHMTVYDNMAFGMKIAKAPKEEIDKRVQAAADILQLTPYLDRLPKALSGGQRQRVAIGRAIVRNPKVFLFDEPLSNLDAALRVATRIEIAKLKSSMPETTMIYVTHDQVEAMTLADRIVVLSAGRIEQVGGPIELYEKPANLFVARFIGSPAMNIQPARIAKTGGETVVSLAGRETVVPIPSPETLSGAPVHFGVRPEDMRIAEGDDFLFEGDVHFVERLGEVTNVYMNVKDVDDAVVVKVAGVQKYAKGDRLRIAAAPEKMHLFTEEGRSLLHI
ncbi:MULTISPECIES: ABC transporter ATP-binding protein [Nitratireductor]|uniref:Maltose ABC transporter ATP-binding protein /trehalose ABC transporter ATP-binding protein /sucrose ABC transporter ATP-binding protein n=1 Tax=Nitratireductor aquibiodomus TaxID=204799 RepID=A0A1H4JFX1_9HYPH|nr:sn-glycerol-3-phosphate ABC transporter ATP-binding protein UgpC [Nitratireductor aquibiodomus]SEB45183.1 maltose ABC transporter ATP-binding protein /trehalose ABC transporter ATP-binding protein /sucrose ABC transporter ATP-binding protein [Nitratireductor aquibiodomus]